jgi:3-deoxy-manno-octulosonate cytidylyltransferase (CMP-KDO synthetase)
MKVAAVIPARRKSTRLPGKHLLPIAGVPLIVRVMERARSCPEIDRIIVATDDEEIRRVVQKSGGEAWLTSANHRTGSDRIAEVAARLDHDLIFNIQGDEPLLATSTIAALIRFGLACPQLTVVTAVVPITAERDIINSNIVKAVVSCDGRALYFSRYPIPYHRSNPADLCAHDSNRSMEGYYKHLGIYLYGREFLLKYVGLQQTPLELAESLEQLRVLEHGFPIYAIPVTEDSMHIDSPEDIAAAEAKILAQGEKNS